MAPIQRLRILHPSGSNLIIVRPEQRPWNLLDFIAFLKTRLPPALGNFRPEDMKLVVSEGESYDEFELLSTEDVRRLWASPEVALTCNVELVPGYAPERAIIGVDVPLPPRKSSPPGGRRRLPPIPDTDARRISELTLSDEEVRKPPKGNTVDNPPLASRTLPGQIAIAPPPNLQLPLEDLSSDSDSLPLSTVHSRHSIHSSVTATLSDVVNEDELTDISNVEVPTIARPKGHSLNVMTTAKDILPGMFRSRVPDAVEKGYVSIYCDVGFDNGGDVGRLVSANAHPNVGVTRAKRIDRPSATVDLSPQDTAEPEITLSISNHGPGTPPSTPHPLAPGGGTRALNVYRRLSLLNLKPTQGYSAASTTSSSVNAVPPSNGQLEEQLRIFLSGGGHYDAELMWKSEEDATFREIMGELADDRWTLQRGWGYKMVAMDSHRHLVQYIPRNTSWEKVKSRGYLQFTIIYNSSHLFHTAKRTLPTKLPDLRVPTFHTEFIEPLSSPTHGPGAGRHTEWACLYPEGRFRPPNDGSGDVHVAYVVRAAGDELGHSCKRVVEDWVRKMVGVQGDWALSAAAPKFRVWRG
ncbi:hypothetical protein M427DRAFT_55363 [Gonapodya prolifera JEL478]|uniref:Uncharacterized protein n=1 Tax=Gonapodya prolifera (strain JEL478) TaxID=1344416 RepID=A0A139AJZ1_GONPJ|nr:hypothetical protein M427DRAFT_55363 [Gonapodya prolifera JEL478]|eukprot:KXS16735.1 hypothetical protein M427DRAFT_55363 [Gonapodya prolifera JEL478]